MNILQQKKVVFGVSDHKWKEGIKALCRLKSGVSINPKERMDFVRDRIAGFKRPEHEEFVLELPDFEDGTVYRAGEVFLLLLIIKLLNFYSSAYSYTSLLFHKVGFVVNKLPFKT